MSFKIIPSAIIIIIGAILTATLARPIPGRKSEAETKILYDQRQEGEWNVRADLRNFVVLIIPTQAAATAPPNSPSASLLDFLMKKSSRIHHKGAKIAKKPSQDVDQETRHFIESKTAPYHVDITKAKLRPEGEDSLLANSPGARLAETVLKGARRGRNLRAFVLSVPEEAFVVTRTEEDKKVVKKDGKKKAVAGEDFPKQPLKLLGAENEQCGPGMARDSYGVCRTLKYLL